MEPQILILNFFNNLGLTFFKEQNRHLKVLICDEFFKSTIPLPSIGDTFFALKKGETIKNLLRNLYREDPSIQHVNFHYKNGARISHCTLLEDLSYDNFLITINGHEYLCKVSVEKRFHGYSLENYLTVNDLEDIVEKGYIYKILNILLNDPRMYITESEYYELTQDSCLSKEFAYKLLKVFHQAALIQHFESNPNLKNYIFLKPDYIFSATAKELEIRFLSKGECTKSLELQKVEKEITELDKLKVSFDKIAYNHANIVMRCIFFYLVLQFSVLAHMVWIDFNWNIVEPVTYFITLTNLIGGYSFFLKFKNDYNYYTLSDSIVKRKLRKLYIDNRFNWKAWNKLDQRRSQLNKELNQRNIQKPYQIYETSNMV